MNYYFSKIVKGTFESIEFEVNVLLQNEGFGVLTHIDMQRTLKDKLNVEFKK